VKFMAKRKKTAIVGLQLRLRESLRRRIEAAAKAEDRSLNSEIVDRLETSFLQSFLMQQLGLLSKQIGLLGEVTDDLNELAKVLIYLGKLTDRDKYGADIAKMAEEMQKGDKK
jgi:hypothetical protein